MYFLRVERNFSAALYISNCDDSYKGMHGHDYKVSVILKSNKLSDVGMVYDYNKIQNELEVLTDKLDHILINDQSEFLEQNPTVENIAKYFSDKLLLSLHDLPLYEVSVSQARGVTASYRPNI